MGGEILPHFLQAAMTKYHKKPIHVEATQWFKMGDHPAVELMPVTFINDDKTSYLAWSKLPQGDYEISYITVIRTDSSCFRVNSGDWIIKDNMRYYHCKPDVFDSTYVLSPEEKYH